MTVQGSATLLTLLTLGSTALGGDSPTIEQVFASPEQYAGKTLVFEKVQISGDAPKRRAGHHLTVKSESGKLVGNRLKEKGFTFVTEADVARNLTSQVQPGQFSPAQITCKIEKMTNGNYWIATVTQIRLLKEKGATGSQSPGQRRRATKELEERVANQNNAEAITETVSVEGVGGSIEEARKNAFRSAVRQVVGGVLDQQTLITNDRLISNRVLRNYQEFVKDFKEVGTRRQNGQVYIKIRAVVRRAWRGREATGSETPRKGSRSTEGCWSETHDQSCPPPSAPARS